MRLIDRHFSHVIDTLDEWEKTVSEAAKRGCATFFNVNTDPSVDKRIKEEKEKAKVLVGHWDLSQDDPREEGLMEIYDPGDPDLSWITQEEHGIRNIVEWSKTSRGGRQFDISFYDDAMTPCNAWGACE